MPRIIKTLKILPVPLRAPNSRHLLPVIRIE